MNVNNEIQKISIKQHLIIEIILFLIIVYFLIFGVPGSKNVDLQGFVNDSVLKISFNLERGLIIAKPNGEIISISENNINHESLKQLQTLAIAVTEDDENSPNNKISLLDKIISPAMATNPKHVRVNVYTTTSEGTSCTRYDKYYHPWKDISPCV